jgi:hypothetical protein
VQLRRASLEQLLTLIAPDAETAISGDVDIDVWIRPGAVWRIRANVLANQAEMGGLDLRHASVPLTIDWSPTSGQISLSTGSARLSVAGGSLSGRLTARRSASWYVDGHFRFFRVDAATLAGESYASGRLSGTLDISGRNARSFDDLQATLLADLNDAQSKGVPLIDQIRNTVPGAGLAGATRFEEGRVEARLAGGVVRVDRLSLANRQLQLFISGVVTLAGRLDLDATVATGRAANPTIAQALLTDLLAVPAAPAALVLQANDFLSNRIVHLSIRGTLRRPSIRLRPFETLGEQAVRFFLRQATGGLVGGRAVAPPR